MSLIKRIIDIESDAHFGRAQERVDRKGRKVFVWKAWDEQKDDDDEDFNDVDKLAKALREEFGGKSVKVFKDEWPTRVELTLPGSPTFLGSEIEFIDDHEAFAIVCKAKKKWGIYFSFDDADMLTVDNAAPWLKGNKSAQCVSDGHGIALFDTEAEMKKAYESTVGDDGPTVSNPYRGHVRVYAMTCDPKGKTQNENT